MSNSFRRGKITHLRSWLPLAVGLIIATLVAGWATYQYIPSLSVWVASTQAGWQAILPGYQPPGYRLKTPAKYSQGQIQLTYVNQQGESYSLGQSRSGWDSAALRASYATPTWGDNYDTLATKGLTIYYHRGSAAWVNGGILYQVSGHAGLSQSTIQQIATSAL